MLATTAGGDGGLRPLLDVGARAYIVMAISLRPYPVTAHIVMAHIVMAIIAGGDGGRRREN